MLCEKCKQREATVRYTYSVNGNSKTYALCTDCYHTVTGTENLFSGWLFPGSIRDMKMKTEVKKCDLCGYTVERIAAESRVGCARCYRTFEKELAPLSARIHGNKVYVPSEDEHKQASEAKELQIQMEKAIKEENFEEAAILRDRIRALKEVSE